MTLGCLLEDGGHTLTDVTRTSDISGNPTFEEKLKDIKTSKREEFDSYCPEYDSVNRIWERDLKFAKDVRNLRTEKLGEGVKYYKEGATAYCVFNYFLCDDSGWRKFYQGEGPRPTAEAYPDDYLIALIDALEKAENDPEVKNFVLDISTNGGGSSDIALFITSTFCNKSDLYYDNVLTGQKMKTTFEVDRNLDGKFDEKDAEVKYHLNFALLVSPYSFSCANLLPALLKDYGMPIIGQQTGGGSCYVLYNPSADGFGYSYSTHRMRVTNTYGENIDPGIDPTYELEKADFYNIPKVTQLIETYYAK